MKKIMDKRVGMNFFWHNTITIKDVYRDIIGFSIEPFYSTRSCKQIHTNFTKCENKSVDGLKPGNYIPQIQQQIFPYSFLIIYYNSFYFLSNIFQDRYFYIKKKKKKK
eukprot:469970_1